MEISTECFILEVYIRKLSLQYNGIKSILRSILMNIYIEIVEKYINFAKHKKNNILVL